MDVNKYCYEIGMKMVEEENDFILTYLSGSEIVQEAHLSKEELKHALWLLAEENGGRLVHFVNPLTDTEQRIFLSAMGRERKICKNIDAIWANVDGSNLTGVCDSVLRKVKATLWGNAKEGNDGNDTKHNGE